ncbi:MAG: ammonium transporter [Planctomycetaceae bacterium]
MRIRCFGAAAVVVGLLPISVTAGDVQPAPAPIQAGGLDPADTAWMLTSSALVLMMTAPGLALFYGGLVRKKNILSVLMQCLFLMGLMSVVWSFWGYSLAFGSDILGGFIGGGDYLLLKNVLPSWNGTQSVVPMAGSIPRSLHMVFQMMFFIITPALICGAFAERMKFSVMCVFSVAWGTLVYCPLAHWIWSDTGWFSVANPQAGFPTLDFAGGVVVHLSSGFSALLCCLLLGKRLGYGSTPMPPHNLTYTCIGTALLWVGWFGFNAGSALGANAIAVNAFVATHLAGACGALSWACTEWWFLKKPSILGTCTGAVAGLACVTPACGSVTPIAGMLIGFVSGVVCYFMCTTVRTRFGYDDTLDVFGVHGTSGVLGTLLTGVFATRAVTGGPGPAGLLEGNVTQLISQLVCMLAAGALSLLGTFVILKVLDATLGLRVDQEQEIEGLDVSEHGEEGYIFI